jgi:hypothetical protein
MSVFTYIEGVPVRSEDSFAGLSVIRCRLLGFPCFSLLLIRLLGQALVKASRCEDKKGLPVDVGEL